MYKWGALLKNFFKLLIGHFRSHWEANFIWNFNSKIKTCSELTVCYIQDTNRISLNPYKNAGEGYCSHHFTAQKTEAKTLIFPWTKAKGKWQAQHLWEQESCSQFPWRPTEQGPEGEHPPQAQRVTSEGHFGRCWEKPPSYYPQVEKASSSNTPPKDLCHLLASAPLSQYKTNLRAKATCRDGCALLTLWASGRCSSPRLHPPFPAQLRTLLPLLLQGKPPEGTQSPPTAWPRLPGLGKAHGLTEAFHIILHPIASSSMYSSALPLNYSSDYSIPLWNVLISSSSPQCQSQISFPHLQTEVKLVLPSFPNCPLYLLGFVGLWHLYLVLSTTCFLPTVHSICKSLLRYLFSPHPTPALPRLLSLPPHTLSRDKEKGALKFHLRWWITWWLNVGLPKLHCNYLGLGRSNSPG